jgi:hypothetical protein
MQLTSTTAGIAITAVTALGFVPAAQATPRAATPPVATPPSAGSPADAGWSTAESPAMSPAMSPPMSPTLSPAGSTGPIHVGRSPSACPSAAPMPERTHVVDGFRLGWLPAGLGTFVSDFTYEWDDVSFTSRVWETGSDDAGWRVDLQVTVMRGDVLSDPAAMHAYLARYHERDPETWARTPFDHLGDPGFRAETALFWLAEPGVAVWVHLDGERFSDQQLVRTACGVTGTTSGIATTSGTATSGTG